MNRRFQTGDRVVVLSGMFVDARGVIVRHLPESHILEWVVRFDPGIRRKPLYRLADRQLARCYVSDEARPVAVGAMKAGSR